MDPTTYAQRSKAVADAFIAAYPDYLHRRLHEIGIHPKVIAPAIDRGRQSLTDAFVGWVESAAPDQVASPLELFRNALVSPTTALAELGTPVDERDGSQQQTLPGDLYDLAPGTSQEIGEEAFQAHVAWGVARAEMIAGMVPAAPHRQAVGAVAVLVATNLMDRTRIAEAAQNVGHRLEVWRNPAAVSDGLEMGRPDVAFVDLAHGAANEAIRRLVDAGVRTVAYGPHVDDLALAAARSLGAAEVLPRSRFFARLPSLFPTLS